MLTIADISEKINRVSVLDVFHYGCSVRDKFEFAEVHAVIRELRFRPIRKLDFAYDNGNVVLCHYGETNENCQSEWFVKLLVKGNLNYEQRQVLFDLTYN